VNDGGIDILAVDGGNSKVDVALVTADGAVLGAARGGGTPFSPGSEERSIAALLGAVAGACREAGIDPAHRPLARVAALCVCGADLPVDDRRIARALKPLALAADLLLHNDTFAVLRAGTDRGWGVGLVCGAGMNCAAVGPTGRVVRYAALGEISGDGGGGGWLGQQAVSAAVRGRDGRGPHTLLERLVPQQFGLRSVPAVLQAIQTGRVREFPAELAPVVFVAAGQGDAVAQGIVDRQADELVAMVVSAVRRLRLTRRDVDVVLGGGVFAGGDGGFTRRIVDGIRAVAPAAHVARLGVPPIVGAALLACDRLPAAAGAGERLRAGLTAARFKPGEPSRREA
jgi:N-acetylglucosamine kinase-like BadF-type ATPase